MTTPGFTAEASMERGLTSFSGMSSEPGGDAAATVGPAGVYVQAGDTIYYCYKCMSGSDEPCCNPVASAPGGTSSPTGTTVLTYLSR
jgi:hypothetical protein